ncbi:MAG: hypothetical protein P8P74_06715 [Crocinitomicaceae bacterium]|nr:hypothetical protein [Crocinitomicaceae bacterium]
MSFKNITIALFALLFLAACSKSEEKREMNEYFSAYLNDNEEVVAFGKAHVNTILEKADYSSVGMLNMIVGSEIEKYDAFIDAKGPVYYAAHGPLKKDGAPEKVVLFLRVKDQGGLKSYLQSEMSFDLNEADGFEYTSDGDMVLGFREHLAVIVLESNSNKELATITDVFKRAEGKVSTGKVAELIDSDEGDIQMGVSLANLYGTASGDLKNQPKSDQKDLEEMLNDGYVKSSVKFENGQAVIEMKNMFGKELKSKMFLAGDDKAPILKELGSGTPRMGFSINMDVKKMEDLANQLSPDALNKGLGGQYLLVRMATGSRELNELWDGKMGVLMFGDPDESGAFTPEFNAYLGVSQKGRDKLKEMEGMGISTSQIPGIPPFTIEENGISVMSNTSDASGKLNLPKGAENFGKSGISFFLNLEGLEPDEMAEMLDMEELAIVLKVAKFVSFEFNNEGGKIIITAKDGKENVLKQALTEVMKEVSGNMGNNFMF